MATVDGSKGKPFDRDRRFRKVGQAPVGKGGKAHIWKAEDLGSDPYAPVVAAKLLKESGNADDRARLEREGGEDRRFDHENVVRIYELRGGPRSPYLVMEWIDGEDLQRLLARRGRLAPERVVEVAIQLCAAMACLHTGNLVHRDIKPANLMLTGNLDGDGPIGLKLIDLGIAQAPGDPEHTMQDQVVGTEPYLAPEVRAGRRAEETADIYGAGMVLYELATGLRLPELTPEEVRWRRRTKPVEPPDRVVPDVPGWLSAVIMRAIDLDPEQRYATAPRMESALLEGEAGTSENPTALIDAEPEAPTELLEKTPMPIVFQIIELLPASLRRQLPEEFQEEEPVHWWLFLLALSSGLIVVTGLALLILIPVIATLLEIPFELLTVLVLGSAAGAWFLKEEPRRRAAADALQVVGLVGWRGVAAAGAGLQSGARAGGRYLACAAAATWRWVAGLSLPDLSIDPRERVRPAPEGPAESVTGSWLPRARPRLDVARARLRGARSQMGRAGAEVGAWLAWLGRRAFIVFLVALTVCLALWLAPALQSRVALQPAGHRAVLTAIPALIWILVAIIGLLSLGISRANPGRLVGGGLVLLVTLTALGMASPSFADWLDGRFWAGDHVEFGKGAGGSRSTSPDEPEPDPRHRSPREIARAYSHKLAVVVRRVEARWADLIRGLRRQGWEVAAGAKAAVHEAADARVWQLNGWSQLSEYEAARMEARHWARSMKKGEGKLTSRDCREFRVGPHGAFVRC